MGEREQKADWLAWGLHYFFGAVVGLFEGYGVALEARERIAGIVYSSKWLPVNGWILCIGFALLLGGGSSLAGDRLWVGRGSAIDGPAGIEHSSVSRASSWISVVVGIMVTLRVVLGWFGVGG